jgi:anti-sigma B factor antagonist
MRVTDALSIGVIADGSDCRMVLSGELDLATAPKFDATLRRICARRPGELEVDICGLTFMDAAGLRAILAARSACAEQFTQFFIAGDGRTHRKLFELAGVYDGLPWRTAA